jgi:ketosteroid isomerase-like protein
VAGATYITHVTVIDTQTGKESQDRTVVISGDRISEVRDSEAANLSAGAKVVDGKGKYLIPGLWDMHVHVWDYESTYPLFIANDVTGVREMFGPPDANKFRRELTAKAIVAPHFYLASPIVDGHPAVWSNSIEVTGADQAKAVVDEQKQKGADFIKVYSRLLRVAYFAIATESASTGIPFEGHVPTQVTALEASDAKQRSFEHLNGIAMACSTREEELQPKVNATIVVRERYSLMAQATHTYSPEKCSRLFARLKTNENWQVPTLTVLRSFGYLRDPQFVQDQRLRYFRKEYRDWLAPKDDFRFRDWTDNDYAVQRTLFGFDKRLVGVMFRSGVPLLAGTDTGNPYCFPGFSLHDELALLVESGLTPLAALQAATRGPAIFMNATDRYGSVENGKIADLVLLDADPLQDIRNTTKISEVFLAGKEYDRAALDLILKNAEQEPNTSLKLSPAEQEVWAQEQTYWQSLKADDSETYLGLWDERFIGWPRYERAPAGKEKIRQEYAPGTTARGKVLDYKLEPLSVRSYWNDVVITFFRATVTRGKPDGEVETRTSRLTHTWLRTDQGWKIIGGMAAGVNEDATLPQSNADENTNRQVEGDDERIQQVLAVDGARRLAMLHGDTNALDPLLADSATIFWGDGTVDDKASTLALLRSGRLRYSQLDYEATRVRLYGQTAVVTGQVHIKEQTEDCSFDELHGLKNVGLA